MTSKNVEELVGQVFADRFEVTSILHSGELSILYRAQDLRSEQNVVMKMIDPAHQLADVFAKEVERIALLEHKNIPRFIDYQNPFYIMEHLKGSTLEKFLSKFKAIDVVEEIGEILLSICDALTHAHQNQVVHGRLKPNKIIFVKEDGKIAIKVTGFGAAEAQSILQKKGTIAPLAYASPEQKERFEATAQADIFSLGLIGYQMVTEQLPSDPFNLEPIHRVAPNLAKADELTRILQNALVEAVDDRYQDVESMRSDINAWLKSTRVAITPAPTKVSEPEKTPEKESIHPVDLPVAEKPAASVQDRNESSAPTPLGSEAIFLEEPTLAPHTMLLNDDLQLEAVSKDQPEPSNGLINPKQAAASLTDDSILDSLLSNVKTETESEAFAETPRSTAWVDDPLINQTLFDKYLILDVIGSSDIAIVYVAKDLEHDRLVAMKTLKSPEPSTVLAFVQEISGISTLKHENLIQFIDFNETSSQPFYIMELVEAPTLSELLDLIKRIETEEQIATTLLQICDVLGYLHQHNQVHGNLAPDNILFLEEEGRVLAKLGGFGTSKVRAIQDQNSTDWRENYRPTDGGISGTVKADIYAVGALAYQLVTGRLASDSVSDSLTSGDGEAKSQPISFLRPEIFCVAMLDQILEKTTSTLSGAGYTSVRDLEEDIIAWIQAVRADMSGADHDAVIGRTNPARLWTKSREVKMLDGEDLDSQAQKIVGLKTAQVKSEHSFGMQVAKTIGGKGRRQSPIAAVVQLIVFSIVGVGTLALSVYYVYTNFEELRAHYFSAARSVSTQVGFTKSTGPQIVTSEKMRVFTYDQDPMYKRWTKAKEIGAPRRIEISGKLREIK